MKTNCKKVIIHLIIFGLINCAIAVPLEQPLINSLALAENKGDAKGVYQIIAQGEMIWPSRPAEYLDFAIQAAVTLERNNLPAVMNIFENVMKKNAPLNSTDRKNYFYKKTVFALRYSDVPPVQLNQKRLLSMAAFIGEIKHEMIPKFIFSSLNTPGTIGFEFYDNGTNSQNYLTRTFLSPTNETPPEKLEAVNDGQKMVSLFNQMLVSHLIKNCAHFSSDKIFITNICDAAALNKEEKNKLLN